MNSWIGIKIWMSNDVVTFPSPRHSQINPSLFLFLWSPPPPPLHFCDCRKDSHIINTSQTNSESVSKSNNNNKTQWGGEGGVGGGGWGVEERGVLVRYGTSTSMNNDTQSCVHRKWLWTNGSVGRQSFTTLTPILCRSAGAVLPRPFMVNNSKRLLSRTTNWPRRWARHRQTDLSASTWTTWTCLRALPPPPPTTTTTVAKRIGSTATTAAPSDMGRWSP